MKRAIREALLDAIVHHDCSYSGSILISIFDDHIEFVSLSRLPEGIAYSDLMLGISVLRNDRLAHVFYLLRLIEAFGTGIPRIPECYHGREAQPAIEVSDNPFKVTLPNTDFRREVPAEDDRLSQSTTIRVLNALADRELILKLGRGKNTRYAAISSELCIVYLLSTRHNVASWAR